MRRQWTSVTSSTRSWGKSSTHTKVALYSEVTRRKTIRSQGLSASQMTAANVLDVIARLLECAGQASDTVSVWTKVKMEDASILLKHPKSECPDSWTRPPRHKWPKSWHNIEEPVVPLARNLCEHPLAGLPWGTGQFEQVLLENGWEKAPTWECLFVHRQQGLFLSVYVDDINMGWKKQNLELMWKRFEENTLIWRSLRRLDQVHLGCTQRECNPNKNSRRRVQTKCSNRESLQEREATWFREKVVQTLLRGSTIWKDIQRNAWNGTANWQTKASSSYIRSS